MAKHNVHDYLLSTMLKRIASDLLPNYETFEVRKGLFLIKWWYYDFLVNKTPIILQYIPWLCNAINKPLIHVGVPSRVSVL